MRWTVFVAILFICCIYGDYVEYDILAKCNYEKSQGCLESIEICTAKIPQDSKAEHCTCKQEYYKCMRNANCMEDKHVECIDQLSGCTLGEMCGIVCTSESFSIEDVEVPDRSVMLPIDNRGGNYIRIRTCDKKLNEHLLDQFGIVKVESCTEESHYRDCEKWVSPYSQTTLTLDKQDITSIEVTLCVKTDAGRNRCLDHENARFLIYGSTHRWVSKITVEQTSVVFCERDEDCLNSTCLLLEGEPLAFCADYNDNEVPLFGKKLWMQAAM